MNDDPQGGDQLPPPPPAFPPPSPPLSLEASGASSTQVVTRSGGRRALLIGLGAILVLAAGLAVYQGDDSETDPDEALADAKDVVEDADGFRYDMQLKSRVVTGDPDGAGTDTTTRSVVRGAVAGDDFQVVEDMSGEGFEDTYEVRKVGDELYSTGFDGEDVGPQWMAAHAPDAETLAEDQKAMLESYADEVDAVSDDEAYADESRVDLAVMAYTGGLTTDASEITRTVTELADPKVQEEKSDGGVVLRATLPPAPELAKVLDDLPPVDATIVLDAEHRPVSVSFRAEVGSASSDVKVALKGWDEDVAIEAPAEAEIDRTPWVSEEALAVTDASLLLQPTVAAPLELVSATVYDFAFDEDAECPTVSLSYATKELVTAYADIDPNDEDAWAHLDDLPQVDLQLAPADCYLADMGDFEGEGASPEDYFDSTLAGLPATGGEGYWEVLKGDVVVTIGGSLDEAQATALLASLHPTTAAGIESSLANWVDEPALRESPFGFGTGFPSLLLGM